MLWAEITSSSAQVLLLVELQAFGLAILASMEDWDCFEVIFLYKEA